MTTSYIIHDGPNAGEFWDAGKYAFDKDYPRRVALTVSVQTGRPTGSSKSRIEVTLLLVQHESGTGHSFIFEGNVVGNTASGRISIRGGYDARDRKGSFQYIR